MKARMLKKNLTLLAAIVFLSSVMYAQQGKGQGQCAKSGEPQCLNFIPDLNDEQKAEIKKLHTEHFQKMVDYKNQLKEKYAKLKTLETSSNPDMKEINAVIDDITKVKNEMLKVKAAHKQTVRKLLNDEQRAAFDAHQSHMRGETHGKKGKGHCNKPCGK